MAEQTRGNDAGVVENEAVPCPQETGELSEAAILPTLFVAVENEHAGSFAPIERPLRDQFFREGVVEIG